MKKVTIGDAITSVTGFCKNILRKSDPSQDSDEIRAKKAWWISVGVQVAMILLITFPIWVFVHSVDAEYTGRTFTSFLGALTFAVIIWAYIAFKTPWFSWWFILPKPNHIVVLTSRTGKDNEVYEGLPTGLAGNYSSVPPNRPPTHWRVAGPPGKLAGKYPFETALENGVADLTIELEIGSGNEKPVKSITSDGVEVSVIWRTTLSAHRKYLKWLMVWNTNATRDYFQAEFANKLRLIIGNMKVAELFNGLTPTEVSGAKKNTFALTGSPGVKLDTVQAQFFNAFGGTNTSIEEAARGVNTGIPQVMEIRFPKEFTEVMSRLAGITAIPAKEIQTLQKIGIGNPVIAAALGMKVDLVASVTGMKADDIVKVKAAS
jgi:hypothetical protein